MFRQPRKSSAFSSLTDAAAPLALTDLAICLKYLNAMMGLCVNKQRKKQLQTSLQCVKSCELILMTMQDIPAHSSEPTDLI